MDTKLLELLDFMDLRLNNKILHLDLFYPRAEQDPPNLQCDSVEIGLCEVRAADSILVRYDFERDGWSILQASTFEWEAEDTVCDPDWQEVAFIQAWRRKKG